MQDTAGADTTKAAGSLSAGPETVEEQALAIEDWVSQESMSMPKDTNGTLIQKFHAALQLLQMVSDKVGCPEPHSRARLVHQKRLLLQG